MHDQALETSYSNHYQTGFFPAVHTETFVKDTVKLIQKSKQADHEAEKMALALRTSAMKHLSSLVNRAHALPAGLTRSEQLTYQLIEAGRFQDEILPYIPTWLGYANHIATRLGLQIDTVAQAIQALYMNRSIWISGGDAHQRIQLARSLSAEVFHSYPYEMAHQQPLISEQAVSFETLQHDAFYQALQMGWDQKYLDVLNSQAPIPTQRQQLVAYHKKLDHWSVFKRAWLLVDQAESYHHTIADIKVALREGVWQTHSTDQSMVRLFVPQDFRIIYLSDQPAHPSHQIVTIELKADGENLEAIYKQAIREHLLTYWESDKIESRFNQTAYMKFLQSVKGLEVLGLIPRETAIQCLKYAIWNGAELAHCMEASELYLHPRLYQIDPYFDGLIQAYHAEDDQLVEKEWKRLALLGRWIMIDVYIFP